MHALNTLIHQCYGLSGTTGQQEGVERRHAHACRLAEQDTKAFLGEMVIVRQDVYEALAAHDVHGDTIREAVLLIETRFVER